MKPRHAATLALADLLGLSFVEVAGWLLFPIGIAVWQLLGKQSRWVGTLGLVLAFCGLLIVIIVIARNLSVLSR